jgi:O-antigen ligase
MSPKLQSPEQVSPAQRKRESKGTRLNRIQSFGFYCTLALIFLRYSFLSDFLTYLTGKETHVLYIFGPPALFAVLACGGFQRTFREKTPKIWLAFLVWICLGVPFSIWRGGSAGLVIAYIKTIFIFLLFIMGLTIKWTECRKIIYAIGGAAVFNVVIALYFMRPGAERFSFTWTTSIGNSNDYAAHLLMILPFLLFFVLKRGGRKLIRAVFLAALVLGLFEILRTASRGALIAIVVVIAFLLLRGSMRQRIAIGATALIVVAIMIEFLPSDTWNRMQSFSSDGAASKEALESSDIREHLLKESIKCTLEHPLFGVGLGQFSNYEGGGRAQSGHVGWRPTHNSYTEISSDCGVPALLLYLAALIWAFRLLSRIKKQARGLYRNEMVTAAYVIRIGIIGYSIAIFFTNFGWAFQFVLVSALVEAIWRAARHSRRPAEVHAKTRNRLSASAMASEAHYNHAL